MIRRNIVLKQIFNFILIFTMIIHFSNIFASEITTKNIFDSINKREQGLKSDIPMSATFYVLIPANSSDPNQGLLLEECSATWNKDNIYMKIDYKYLKDPAYVNPNSKFYQTIDYDSKKRLIIWRHLKVYIISTADKTERIDEMQLLLVSPDGTIEIKGSHTSKDIFPSNSLVRGDFDFRSFLYASGLNFSDSIIKDNALLEKNTNENNIIAFFKGKFGKGSKGIWKLTVDPNNGFFVNDASYTPTLDDYNNPAIQPTIRISTSDIVKKDGLQYARQGRLTHIYTMDFADIIISKKDNLELREEVKKRMTNLPPGSRITDFNGIKPTVMTSK